MLDVSQNEKDNGDERAERTRNRSQPTEDERANTKNSNKMVWIATKLGILQISRRGHAANQLENDRKADESETENKTNATVEEIEHDLSTFQKEQNEGENETCQEDDFATLPGKHKRFVEVVSEGVSPKVNPRNKRNKQPKQTEKNTKEVMLHWCQSLRQ